MTEPTRPCGTCGMPCTPGEYHPYAACLMFKACHNSEAVRANLEAVRATPQPTQAREIEGLRKQDDALILQLVEALCECAEDSQEQLDRMEAARLRDYKPNAIAWQEDTIAKAKAAILAGRARLEGKP